MADPNLTQGAEAMVALLTGVALGLGMDARRALQLALKPPRWATGVLDVCCVAALAPVAALGLLLANWGEPRLHVLLAMALGLGLYWWLGSPALLPAGVWLLRLIPPVGAALVHGLLWPFGALAAVSRRVLPPHRGSASQTAPTTTRQEGPGIPTGNPGDPEGGPTVVAPPPHRAVAPADRPRRPREPRSRGRHRFRPPFPHGP